MGYSQNKLSVYSQCKAKMIPCVYHIRKLANILSVAIATQLQVAQAPPPPWMVWSTLVFRGYCPGQLFQPIQFIIIFPADHIFLFAVV